MAIEDSLMYEYNQLREEIKEIKQRRIKMSLFVTTFTATYVPFVLEYTNEPLYLAIVCGVIFGIYLKFCAYWDRLINISSYIIVYLEPNIPGIRWESTYLELLQQKEAEVKNKLKKFLCKNIIEEFPCEFIFMYTTVFTIILTKKRNEIEKNSHLYDFFSNFLSDQVITFIVNWGLVIILLIMQIYIIVKMFTTFNYLKKRQACLAELKKLRDSSASQGSTEN